MILLFRTLRTRPAQTLTIHPEARPRWAAWYDENRKDRNALPPLAREMASKFPAHLATIWLVLHCLWDPDGRQSQVRLVQLDAAITLVEYFRAHARRVMTHFGTNAPHVDAGLAGRIAAILRDGDDWCSKTDLSNAMHRNVKAEALEAALSALVADGSVETMREGEGVRARSLYRWIGVESDDLDDEWPEDDLFTSYEVTNQSTSEPVSAVSPTIDSFDSYESKTLPIAECAPARPRTCFSCGGTRFRPNGVCLRCHPDPNADKEEIA